MPTKFDQEASQYDDNFTNSKIGRTQRQRVWNYLNTFLYNRKEISVLELNCGTGEDAIYLAHKGHRVLATDLSQTMLNISLTKVEKQKLSSLVTFEKLDLENPSIGKSDFELVFSNFGGLNCIPPDKLKSLANFLIEHTKQFSEFIFVIMPRQNFMEKLFRIFKGSSHIYSAKSNSVPLNIDVSGETIETYFYNPEEFLNYFPGYVVKKKLSIGYVPSFMNGSRFLPFLFLLEKLLFAIRLSPKRSDHYLLHLKRRL